MRQQEKSMASAVEQMTVSNASAPLGNAPLSRFLRVEDSELAAVGDAFWDLKQALALQCVYLTGCCHRARSLAVRGPSDGKNSAIEKALSAGGVSSVTVGVIGGGVMGGMVAHALLDAGIPPPAVLMSTRSPRRQKDLAARGVAVVFDNALIAARCQLLILCVLPAQLQDVAKTLKPSAHTVVLSLVGATPIAKIRSLFHSPHALPSGADATLPLLVEAQSALRREASDGGEPIDHESLSAGRLQDDDVLEHAACGFAPDAHAVARLVNALRTVCGDLELPHALAQSVAIEALFGTQPQGVVHAIHREVDEANAEMAKQPVKSAAAPPPPPDAKPKPADNDDDEFDELRERFGVPRLQAAFVNRIRGTAPDPEPDEYD